MRSSAFLPLAPLAALAAGLPACSSPDDVPLEPARNVVVIVLDTLRPDHLGAYGYGRETSPRLDAFAERSTVFLNAQSAAPWTAPSLHSLVTGLYPSVHGVMRYPNPGRMSERVVTLAEVLKGEGFATAAFTEGGFARGQFGLDQGFDTFPENEAFNAFVQGRSLDQERLEKQVAEASAWIVEHAEERFFLLFHTYRPHIPWDAPEADIQRWRPDYDEAAEHALFTEAIEVWNAGEEPSKEQWLTAARHLYHCNLTAAPTPRARKEFGERLDHESRVRREDGSLGGYDADLIEFVIDLYDAAIRHTDAEIAGLLDKIAALGLDEDTVVLFVSDHGEGLGEHGRIQHGKVLHEEALRVLLMLHVPGTGPASEPRRVDDLVRSVDVMPTLLELLGVAHELPLNGESLVPHLYGSGKSRLAVGQALNRGDGEDAIYSIRDANWRLIVDRDARTERLYDRANDPEESQNVLDAHPDVAARLREALDRQLANDAAMKRAVAGEIEWSELDAETRAELEQLGYTGE